MGTFVLGSLVAEHVVGFGLPDAALGSLDLERGLLEFVCLLLVWTRDWLAALCCCSSLSSVPVKKCSVMAVVSDVQSCDIPDQGQVDLSLGQSGEFLHIL